MIMGNKCDMEDKRIVSTERGQEVARSHGIPFIETSAKTNVNITRAFYDITERILEKQPEKKPDAASSANIQPNKSGVYNSGANSNNSSSFNRFSSCC